MLHRIHLRALLKYGDLSDTMMAVLILRILYGAGKYHYGLKIADCVELGSVRFPCVLGGGFYPYYYKCGF